MSIDFTKMPGTSNPQGIPSWLEGLFGIKKTASTKTAQDEGGPELEIDEETPPIESEDLFEGKEEKFDKPDKPEDEGDELSKEDIEEMLLKKDPLSGIKDEEMGEKKLMARVDPVIRPYSKVAQEKIAGHWAGDTPEERKKAEGDIVNDGDKVRDAEEGKFTEEAGNTEKRLAEENKPRNSIWEMTEGKKKEASSDSKLTKMASVDDLTDEEKKAWKAAYKSALNYAIKEKKEGAEKIAESYAWKKIAKSKKDKKKDKKEEDEKKDEKKDKVEDEKKEEKEDKKAETAEDREVKLALRSYRRNQLLQKLAKKDDDERGAHESDVQFPKNWYDEIVGDKKNIGNVREAEFEAGVEKEASADVGLAFEDDPQATGEYGAGGDFKVNEVYDENAEVMKGDVEKEPYDDANYSKDFGTTRAASGKQTVKKAHYNNRTQDMEDDGPTAPEQQDDGRDTFLRKWWLDQAAMTKKFIDKEYKILGDGKKEMHTDAIPVFKDKAAKNAFITNRRIKREAIVGKVAADTSDKSYYADAYGDASYAAQMFDDHGVKKPKTKKAETLEERAALRRKIAGLDTGMVKEAALDANTIKAILANPAARAALSAAVTGIPVVGPVLAAAISTGVAEKIIDAVAKTSPEVQGQVQGAIDKAKAVPAPAAAGAAAAANELQMRKEARKKILAEYGEPVKEPDSSKVGDPDWDASELTRNSIIDAPQSEVIKQIEQSISNVRGALKK